MIGRLTLCGILATVGCLAAPGVALAAPPNDNFANAAIVTTTASGTNDDATKEAGEPNHAGDPGGASVWYRWTAPISGTFAVDTCGSNFDTLLGVYTGSAVNGLTEVAANDQSSGQNCPFTDRSETSFAATMGVEYRIAVDGWSDGGTIDPDQGDVDLTIELGVPPSNDPFASPEPLSGSTVFTAGDNFFATKEAGEPNHAGDQGGASVWYSWTAPSSDRFRVDTCNSDFPTLLGVYTGTMLNALTTIASNAGGCGGFSRAFFDAVNGTTYRIAVDGDTDGGLFPPATGHLSLSLRPASPPANDDLANATVLPSFPPQNPVGNNVDATEEAGEPDHAGNPGGASVWYRWTAPFLADVTLSGCPTYDSLLAVYTGSAVGSLTAVAGNDDDASIGCANPGSRVDFRATAGTTYWIAVDGYFAEEGFFQFGMGVRAAFVPGSTTATIDRITTNNRRRTATVWFSATQPVSHFVCSLDGDTKSVPCTSPHTVGASAPWMNLTRGGHFAQVTAFDLAGRPQVIPTRADFVLKKPKKKKKKRKRRRRER